MYFFKKGFLYDFWERKNINAFMCVKRKKVCLCVCEEEKGVFVCVKVQNITDKLINM